MGIIVADRSLLALVRVRQTDLGGNHGTDIDVFMGKLSQFMEDVAQGNDVQISSQAGTIWAEETRLETDVEYDSRVTGIREAQREVQKKSDSSWERQKRKFARAHKNGKA
jgi:hypothetical protein